MIYSVRMNQLPSHYWDKIPDKKGRVDLGSQLEDMVPCDGSWSRYMPRQETEETCSYHTVIFLSLLEIPAHALAPPTFWEGFPTSINSVQKLPHKCAQRLKSPK